MFNSDGKEVGMAEWQQTRVVSPGVSISRLTRILGKSTWVEKPGELFPVVHIAGCEESDIKKLERGGIKIVPLVGA